MQISRVEAEKYLRWLFAQRAARKKRDLASAEIAAQTRIAFYTLGCHFPRNYSAIGTRNIAPNLGIKSGSSKFTARKVDSKDEEVRSLEKVACPETWNCMLLFPVA